jgi:uncharacterized protein (TIGR03000 family)
MTRFLFASAVAALAAVPASAQIPVSVASGTGSFGGGFRPGTPSLSAPIGRGGPMFAGARPGFTSFGRGTGNFRFGGGPFISPASANRGLYGGYSPYGYGGGYYGGGYYGGGYYGGGGFITGGYGGYGYSPYFVVPGPGGYYDDFAPAAPAQPLGPPARVVELSGQLPAKLSLEFPATAAVWLDGKQLDGGPSTTWTLTSPVLRPGEQYTFHIKARWETNGKTYEYTREVAREAGDQSRLLVVSGTAVDDNK